VTVSDAKRVHRDCLNYAPLDGIKGICHRTKDPVSADMEACAEFAAYPKCRVCGHYGPDAQKSGIGICGASKNRFAAYADMRAGTCEDYKEKA
jgi:hypothetical protein